MRPQKGLAVTSFRRVIKNIVALLCGDFLGRVTGMATAILLARYLGPEDYGKYSLVISFVYIFGVLADFGMDDLMVREIARNRAAAGKYLGASILLKPLFSTVGILAINLSVYLMNYSSEILLCTLIFSMTLIFSTLSNAISAVYRAYERMEYVSLITILQGVVGLLLIAGLVLFHGTLPQIIFSRVITFFAGFLVGFAILLARFARPDFSFGRPFIGKTISRALPFLTLGIIYTLYFKIDIIMLSKLKGEIFVGWYTPAATDLFFGLIIIPRTISLVTFPLFSRQSGESLDGLARSCNFMTKLVAILGVATSVGALLLAPHIINFIFGPAYEKSVPVFQIVALGLSFVFLRDPLSYVLAAVGKVKLLMWINVSTLVLNVLLNLLLIPLWAHLGAAAASLICQIISFFLTYHFLAQEIAGLKMLRYFGRPLLAALIMGLAILPLRGLNLFLITGLGAAVYLGAIFLLRAFSPAELAMLQVMLKRKKPVPL